MGRNAALPLTAGGAPVAIRVNPRARRLTLRIDPEGTLRCVVPEGVPAASISAFLARHDDWIRGRLARLPPPLPFADGAAIPLLGREVTIRHVAGTRTATRLDEDGRTLLVGGEADFLARRVRDFLKDTARRELTRRAWACAARIDRRVAGVTVRDTRSRWGSCAASGRLAFSWRLVMTPDTVMNYVVAHEVAHLAEMNHGPRFWALCRSLAGDIETPRAWLRQNGTRLLRIGA